MTRNHGSTHNQNSTRRLAELAKAGYLLTRDPTLQVDFEVHHIEDVPGYFFSLIRDDSARTDFVECLAAGANGVGVVIGTRTGSDRAPKYRLDPDDGVVIDDDTTRIFTGAARPNPSFTFESALTFEAVISIGHPEPETVSFRKSLLIKELLGYVAHLAAGTIKVPILSTQWPAQIPAKVRGRPDMHNIRTRDEGAPPYSSSQAIRFSMALGESSSADRLRLAKELIRFAEERGFGLWLADTRPGYRTGNWFHVRGYDSARAEARGRAKTLDDEPVTTCLPVTFVGPARVGSTSALLSFLEALPFVGIVGFSNTTLDDLAFIHLQLSLRGLTTAGLAAANRKLTSRTTHVGSPMDILGEVFSKLGFEHEFERSVKDWSELTGRAVDYKTLARNVYPCVPPPPRRRMAVWFSWQAEGDTTTLAAMMKALYRAFEKTGLIDTRTEHWTTRDDSPSIEYLICRQLDYSILRGKGKISMPKDIIDTRFKEGPLERPASKFCAKLEAAWQAELADMDGSLELTVAWREAWLGHWLPGTY
ncbi:MAG TPA: hypothetical protein VFX16_19605 [Pseudonocardiaceae bacterium]|nr:hypothetical protein [Pseudonocardiaceae bacterium]